MDTDLKRDGPTIAAVCYSALTWPLSRIATAAFWFAGAGLPLICFLLTAFDSPFAFTVEWQSGNLNDYMAFLLGGPYIYPIYIFLLYAITCFTLLMFWPHRLVSQFVIRLGVYSGVLVALPFCVIMYGCFLKIGSILSPAWLGLPLVAVGVTAVPWGFWLGWNALEDKQRWVLDPFDGTQSVWNTALAVIMGVLAVTVALVVASPLFGAIIFGSLFSAPFWALAVYLSLSLRILRLPHEGWQFRLGHLFVVFAWFGGYVTAWRTAVLLALDAYSQLPTEPPQGCYVATAAARGHARLVGAKQIEGHFGDAIVNRQLATLKCGELAIKTLAPDTHRALRNIYDWLGPKLASYLSDPWRADVAYLSLKPCEWAARAGLRILIGDADVQFERIYEATEQAATGKPPAESRGEADLGEVE